MKLYTYKGKSLSAKEWATVLGISRDSFYQRIRNFRDKDKIFECGYLHKVSKIQKHGKSGSSSYNSWKDMHRRCSEISQKKHRYFDRGIIVCDRWSLFENFLIDMGERPSGTTLDRINNNGIYEPGNCRWATPKQQGRNTSSNHLVIHNGKEMTLIELAEEVGVDYSVLRQRLFRKIPLERALTKGSLR